MIHFSGVFQLAAINKEDQTRSGDKIVYFTAFSRRGDQSDKVFCKVFGKTAEYLMRNLTKKDDGKYISRKMELAGTIETYKQAKMETLPGKTITPDMLDPQLGLLKTSITINFTREVEEEKFMFKVSYLEFVDKKRETEVIEIYRGTGVNAISDSRSDDSMNEYVQESSLASSLNQVTEELQSPAEIMDFV